MTETKPCKICGVHVLPQYTLCPTCFNFDTTIYDVAGSASLEYLRNAVAILATSIELRRHKDGCGHCHDAT